jgi:hypothetical protein
VPREGDRPLVALLRRLIVHSDDVPSSSERKLLDEVPNIGVGALDVADGGADDSATLASTSGAETRAIDPASDWRPWRIACET